MIKAKVEYFPGTLMARMNTLAGVRMRTKGTGDAVLDLQRGMEYGIAAGILSVNKGKMPRDVKFALRTVENLVTDGLFMVAAQIRDDMDNTPPLIPVETGALRASFKIVASKSKDPNFKTAIEMGWPDTSLERKGKTVDQYAAYVHEMTVPPYTKPINWTRRGSGAKFFEASIKRNAPKAVAIIGNHIKRSLGL